MNDEMASGYRDGLDPDSPAPSANRSHAYRHGFANGRDDLRRQPRASAQTLREMAAKAEELDRVALTASAHEETGNGD